MTPDKIIVNGVEYAPVTMSKGTRAVVVVDRGWIFAGDVTRENGRIRLFAPFTFSAGRASASRR